MLRRWLAPLSVARRTGLETASTLLALMLLGAATGLFTRLDNLFYDSALALRSRPAPPDIVIVAIDERSLAEVGRWPWSRRIHASLVDRLTESGTAAVAFDVLFAEPQTDDPGADAELARAIAAHGRVVLPVYAQLDTQLGRLRAVPPLPQLQQAAAALGHVHIELDADSIVRRQFLYFGQGAHRWPALAMAAAEAAGGVRHAVAFDDDPTAPWMQDAELLLPFAGGAGHFRRISAVDVLRDPRVAAGLRGGFVFIGATAAGLQRDFATPMSGLGPPLTSVELHANVLDALREGLGIRPLAWPWSIALAVVPLLLAVLVYGKTSGRGALFVTVLLLAAVAAVALLLLHRTHTWLPPTPALLAVLLAYPMFTWRRTERTAHSLAAEQQRGQATLRAIGDGVITADRDGRIAFVNPQAERMTGMKEAQLRGRPLVDALQFADADERARFVTVLERCPHSEASTSLEGQLRLRSAQGRDCDVRVSVSPVRLPNGRFDGTVLALTDLTENVEMTRRIAYQATHDSLTALPNRTLLIDRLEHAIASARRSNAQVAVLFLDLDDFKRVNDGFGHGVGDELLREVAQRLRADSRANDTVARWGGDEFLIVAEEIHGAEAAAVVARKLLDRLSVPFAVLGSEVHISGSIGISLFPGDGYDPQVLVQNADRAMYQAKRQGRNRVQFFSETINRDANDRRQIEAGLRSAIARDEFELHYQPQIELGQCTVAGAEVLLRWRHPQAGALSPDRFISVAEECGLIHEIGAWVLHNACLRWAAWRDAGLCPVPLSINVSPRQLLGHELASLLRNILAETRMDPTALALEITESATMHDIDRVAVMLHGIRALGVRISIDDFGTGYSSLSLLRRLPLQQIKIDRSFVLGVASNAGDATITRGVIALARGMGVKVVAEGVETAAQLAFLRENACDMAQGNFISPPVPEAQFLETLRAWEAPAGPLRSRLLERLITAGIEVPTTRH